MNRRQFGILSLALLAGKTVRAQECNMVAPGIEGCRAKLAFPNVVLASTLQECPEWCWAASISMVFKFFNHPLDQKRIVAQKYGQLACLGARTAADIASDLSDSWTDDNGNDFDSSLTAAYDAQAGVLAMNNAVIVNELLHQRPLLYCNTHHAMVVCAADYRPSPAGPLIDALYVMDPWPFSPRIHALSPPEVVPAHVGGQMMFIASIEVS